MSEAQIQKLTSDWHRFHKERDQAANAEMLTIANSYESSIAAIEDQLNRQDIDPRDYDSNGLRK